MNEQSTVHSIIQLLARMLATADTVRKDSQQFSK